jgi:hypothetical protein
VGYKVTNSVLVMVGGRAAAMMRSKILLEHLVDVRRTRAFALRPASRRRTAVPGPTSHKHEARNHSGERGQSGEHHPARLSRYSSTEKISKSVSRLTESRD